MSGLRAHATQGTSAEDISELDILELRRWLIVGDPPTPPQQHWPFINLRLAGVYIAFKDCNLYFIECIFSSEMKRCGNVWDYITVNTQHLRTTPSCSCSFTQMSAFPPTPRWSSSSPPALRRSKVSGLCRRFAQRIRARSSDQSSGYPSGREYQKNDPAVTVDYNTADPVVRWDSYENFNQRYQDSLEGNTLGFYS